MLRFFDLYGRTREIKVPQKCNRESPKPTAKKKMDRKGKGKQVAGIGSSSDGKKRKSSVEFRDEGLRIKKRKNPDVLKFFEESAEVGYFGGSSDEDDDFLNDMEDEPEVAGSGKDSKGEKGKSSFVLPKEEEINEEEFDRIMEERYKPGSGFFKYAEDDVKDSIEMDALAPTSKDPPIWKVKCAIGRERHSVFCLMHKFVELRKIRTNLQIISVFSVGHVKGFIFIEADKEQDVLEACKSLTGIYATRMVLLPKDETPNLLTVQRKTKKISEGTWARVKNGKYKGDLAQVVAVSDTRRKALIKLIPRIDIQALTQKYGGGVTIQKGQTPAPRLISSSELEEFRPLIQVRRDRDTGITFEHLDSLMLKDGYLYKKVSLDSLSSWGIIPSKEEILKFTPVDRKETGDVEWISEIYGEERKKNILPTGRRGEKGEGSGGGKGDGSSESKSESSYKLYNLVCFSRKDFGLIVGVDDKGDGYKVLKEGPGGHVVVTVGKKEMQNGPFNSKFTALDLNKKQISVNDVVKISKGPSEGKQGVVRQVYRGIIFLYDESEEENGGYFCCKSQLCEKVKLFTEESNEKSGGFNASAFGDSVSSPKSPLSPEKEWQPREKYSNSNQGDKGSMYSIGQKLRIRVGPLKGYLCRVIALRYSDVTVKLDSQHKVFTVKSEHLAEVRDRKTLLSTSGDVGIGSFQPFDMLGTEGSSGDWAKGAGTSGEVDNWNLGGPSTDWNPWGSKSTSDVSSHQPTVTEDNTSLWTNAAAEKKPSSAGDWNSWGKTPASEAGTVAGWGDAGASKVADLGSWNKPTTVPDDNTSTWTNAAAENKPSSAGDQPGDWISGGKTPASEDGAVAGWGDAGASKIEASSWGKKEASTSSVADLGSWSKHGGSSDANKQEDSVWGKLCGGSESSQKKEDSSWGKKGESESGWGKGDGQSNWGNKDGNSSASNKEEVSWGQQDKDSDGSKRGSAWGNQGGGFGSGEKKDGSSGWNKSTEYSNANGKGAPGWGKPDGGSSWGKKDNGESSWGKKDDGGASWGKKDDGGSAWGNQGGGFASGEKKDGSSGWNKSTEDSNSNGKGAPGWGKPDGGSSWGKKDNGESSWGKKDDGGASWGKKDDGGSAWGNQGGGFDSGEKKDGSSGWNKSTEDSNANGKGAPGWGKPDGGSSWGRKDDGESSWGKKDDGGASWGKKDDGGASWGKKDDGGSSWGKKNDGGYTEQTVDRGGRGFGGRRGGGHQGGRDQFGRGRSYSNSEDPAPWNKPSGRSSWGKQDSDGGGSSWGNENNVGGESRWGKQDTGGGGSSWGKQETGGGGSSWGKQETGGGGSSWGKQNDASGGGSSWGKQDGGGGGSSWGKQDAVGGGSGSAWGKQNDGGGGLSWSKDGVGGSKPWNEQSGGGRGFGGRRGGFRGGRDVGRSFDGDQSSGWKRDNQESPWKRDQSGGGSDWKKGWGEDSKPSGASSDGGARNWPSWDTNLKKETNDKAVNESKSAWGTGNDQADTGNNNDGWGGKTNAVDKKTGW